MTTPEKGKRYRMSRVIEVAAVHNYSTLGRYSGPRVEDLEGLRFRVDAYDWEELEPEYEQGALYIDANNVVWIALNPALKTWIRSYDRGKGSLYIENDSIPARPLTRLYREDER